MNSLWNVRKGSAFPILGAAFALIALAFSVVSVTISNALYFKLPTLCAVGGGDLAALILLLLSAASAVILLAVCAGYGLGLSAKSLILAAAMLMACSLCRFVTDLYTALFVTHTAFYPFSGAHLDLLFSLALLLCVIFTVTGQLRTPVPTVLIGFGAGIAAMVLSLLRIGCYGSSAEIDLSGMVFYVCFCASIALCALALERSEAVSSTEQPQQAPCANAAQTAAVEPTVPDVPDTAYTAPIPPAAEQPKAEASPAAQQACDPIQEARPDDAADAPVPTAASNAAAVSTLLQQAAALHAQGILTDEEYTEKCRIILEKF